MIIVILKNKLITFDLIAPLLHEIRERDPEVPVRIYSVNSDTIKAIRTNSILAETLESLGGLKTLTDSNQARRKSGATANIIRKLRAVFVLLQIASVGFLRNARIIHFGVLDNPPLRFLHWFFTGRVLKFAPTANGFAAGQKILAEHIKERKHSSTQVCADCLCYFSDDWRDLELEANKGISRLQLTPPYVRPSWEKFLRGKIADEKEREGLDGDRPVIAFLLSSMDNVRVWHEDTDPVDLYAETLEALCRELPHHLILVRRHPATLPKYEKIQQEIVDRIGTDQVRFTRIAPQLLAMISDAFIANAFSTTFENAHDEGIPTIEYTHYPDAVSQALGGKSTRPDLTTHFIDNDSDELARVIASIQKCKVSRPTRQTDAHLDRNYEEVLEFLMARRKTLTQ